MSYSAEAWAKGLMAQKINAQQLVAKTYKETLRFMLATFAGLKIIGPQGDVIDVPCINANPERTVAKLYQDNNIILPVITVGHLTSTDNEERRRPHDLLVNESHWDEQRRRAFRVISFAPRAINITYDINIWTKYNEDMDQLAEQIRLVFSPDLKVVTKYTNSTAAFITDETNDSVLVVGDREDRIIRRKFEINVEGYIPYPRYLISSTGEITEFNTEFDIVTDCNVSLDNASLAASSINSTEVGTFTQK
tara:strand:+ start:1081 stop:1830 length:750 start_codon:yes stop_codon:yes gene_type:complete